MSELSDKDLAGFVGASAAILGLPLDDQALAAVTDVMRGLLKQAEIVLDAPSSEVTS